MPNSPAVDSDVHVADHQAPIVEDTESGRPRETEGPPPESASGWGPRVLVVDDDELARLAAVGLLQALGLTVDVASTGRQALAMSEKWPYTAIFMDCGMPDMDGYTAARQLRRREGTSLHTPVIAMTSHPRSVSLASGMDHHLAKPLRIDVLGPDCTRLGLLARNGAGATRRAEMLAMDAPLLDPTMFADPTSADSLRPVEPATAFIEDATFRLPDLWRAANARDASTLRRLALALKARAGHVGAHRVTELCGHLSKATPARAADIEAQLRQAVDDTSVAVRAYLDEVTSLAAAALHAADPGNPGSTSSKTNGSDPRALVRVALADDDALARVAIGAMLESADWLELVGDAPGVEDIVELVAVKRPEVVVVDWMMPGGGGREAARRILELRPDTLIVALTSSDSRDALDEMIAAGASCLVAKGGSAKQLTQTIGRALRASRTARAAEEDKRMLPPDVDGAMNGAAGPAPLDPAGTDRLRTEFGSTGVLAELVALFGSQTPGRVTAMRQEVQKGDAGAVSESAHRLKGGCLTLAATHMAELCGELEMAADSGSLVGAVALLDQIEAAFAAAYAALLVEVT
jgi:CheY-like chemotaxis protein